MNKNRRRILKLQVSKVSKKMRITCGVVALLFGVFAGWVYAHPEVKWSCDYIQKVEEDRYE